MSAKNEVAVIVEKSLEKAGSVNVELDILLTKLKQGSVVEKDNLDVLSNLEDLKQRLSEAQESVDQAFRWLNVDKDKHELMMEIRRLAQENALLKKEKSHFCEKLESIETLFANINESNGFDEATNIPRYQYEISLDDQGIDEAGKAKHDVENCFDELDTHHQLAVIEFKKALNDLSKFFNVEEVAKRIMKIEIADSASLEEICSMLFNKAISNPELAPKVAALSHALKSVTPMKMEVAQKKRTLKQILITKCQMEFESSERLQKDSAKDQKHAKEIVNFIGELYNVGLLTTKIMVDLIEKIMENPTGDKVGRACLLLTIIGQQLEESLCSVESPMLIPLMGGRYVCNPSEFFVQLFQNLLEIVNRFKTLEALINTNRVKKLIRLHANHWKEV